MQYTLLTSAAAASSRENSCHFERYPNKSLCHKNLKMEQLFEICYQQCTIYDFDHAYNDSEAAKFGSICVIFT